MIQVPNSILSLTTILVRPYSHISEDENGSGRPKGDFDPPKKPSPGPVENRIGWGYPSPNSSPLKKTFFKPYWWTQIKCL